mgnify:CR=1 FL=1
MKKLIKRGNVRIDHLMILRHGFFLGKKTAERLMIEMRDRLQTLEVGSATAVRDTTLPPTASSRSDALGALLALGYKNSEAQRMLKDIDHQNLATEDVIRQALQKMKS